MKCPTLCCGFAFLRAGAALTAALFIFSTRSHALESLHADDTVAICGDSITEQKIYSVYVEEYLLMCQPAANLQAHQFGWSGETATGFLKRLETDVLPFRPTVATTLYGMNDGGYTQSDPKTAATFSDNTEAIIHKFQSAGVRFILIGSPGVVDSDKFKKWRLAKCSPDDYNQTLATLGEHAREVAARSGATFVDVHGAMMAAMVKAKAKYGADYPFVADGVHPSFNGHLVMAYAFLKALGCDGEIGTITYDAQVGTATASAGHKILGVSSGKVTIESTRYPFCFRDDPANRESTRAVLDCVPFNEELNRFRLVVRNSSAPKMKVIWGANEKIFTAEQLATGINLAAEFPDNPFGEAFGRVEAAVRAQQAFETPAVKTLLHSLPVWQANLPDEQATFTRLEADLLDKARALNAEARRVFVPVRHTLILTVAP